MESFKIVEVNVLLSNVNKDKEVLERDDELEKLYQIYLRVQSGEKSALDELFIAINCKSIPISDEINRKQRMANMDNVLDSELVIENEKNRQEEEWTNSVDSNVTFRFSCLKKLLYKKKRGFLTKAKNTGYDNGVKIERNNCSKFYESEYDVSDFNELMYETIIEIFNKETDANNCLTLYGKKNSKFPICDSISLLKNISYFTSIKVNNRAEKSHLDISDIGSFNEESEEDAKGEISYYDKYAFKEFNESKNSGSRLSMYEEYLEWLKRNDIYKLFKINARDIDVIIETIMNVKDTFKTDIEDGIEVGLGMHLVKQKVLQEIIRCRHNINIEHGNISKDLEIIEKRLLDHLFYSLNYKIDKAEESKGIYKKESERFLNKLNNDVYTKMFSWTSYTLYNESILFINSDIDSIDCNSYFEIIKKYEDLVIDIVSPEKGKKKYDMCNLILENDDLVEDKRSALVNVANTIIAYCQNREKDYKKEKIGEYREKRIVDFSKGYWETILGNEFLTINFWSSKSVKKPIKHRVDREKLMVYCGYMNFYICDIESKVYYSLPRDRRIISRSNKNHKIKMYNVD